MKKQQNRQVAEKFNSYPSKVRSKMLSLRQLVLDVAAESNTLDSLEETLKWGEPSYLVRGGSTIRMEWKASSPDHYAIYFNCKSKLVETFSELYGDLFSYQGNRALVFALDDALPTQALQHCILLALEYHKRKHLPLLGA